MNEWKQAWQLSKMELKRQIIWFIPSALLFILLAFFLGLSFQAYIDEHALLKEQNPGLYDLAFLFLFWIVPYWLKPKDFRYQQVSGDFWVSPYFIKLLQLPIPEHIIIKSRFLTYLVQSVPFHVLFLLFFYLFSGLRGDLMSPVTFAAFSIIWLSFGIYAGHVFPASDAGDRISPFKLVLLSILFGAIGLGVYVLIAFVSPHGLVAWAFLFATKWPVLSSLASILLAFLGMRYWMHYMKKTMNKLDYL